MDHQSGHLLTSDGVDLFVQTWAGADHPQGLIFVVHGLGEHSSRYQNYVDYFVPRGYTVAAFDTRGHGRSGGARVYVDRFQRYIDDISLVMAHVRSTYGNLQSFLIGHSLGSLIVLSYGLQHPDDIAGIVVTGSALRDALALPGWKRRLAGTLSRLAPTLQIKNGVVASYLTHDPAVVAAYESDPLVQLFGTPRLLTEVESTRVHLLERAGQWRVPLLMLHGRNDQICLLEGARAFYTRLPAGQAELLVYDGLCHELHNELDKEKVFSDIERWLTSQHPLLD